MVSAISPNTSLIFLNNTANRLQSSTTAFASGSTHDPLTSNSISTEVPAASTDTSDLTGITNPDDPTNSNPPNVSYNVASQTLVSTSQSGGDIDLGAASIAQSTNATQFQFGIAAQTQGNDEKKQLLDILT